MDEPITRADAPPDRVTALWRQAKDHRLAQWTVGYVAVAYGIQHAVVLTGEAFEWPQAVQRISMLLLALGVPLAMTFAWYHGDSANRRVSGAELSIISILLLGVSLLFYAFVRPAEPTSASARDAGVTAARQAAANPKGALSIAVLPFVNLSGDASQEFFSDGMTEEITSALAKIPNLQVVGRTSAFQFKGENKDLTTIGQALHASHLIEGSVRKDGNEVRITAQLIRADNGTHLWTESYNRELKGVFAVQEEIATAIAGALQVPLGLKQGETLVSNRMIDPASYEDYLRARAMYHARNIGDAAAILERVVGRDSNYAPAWGLLAQVYEMSPTYTEPVRGIPMDQARLVIQSAYGKAEKAAREAVRLDPKLARGHAALGYFESARRNWAEADDEFKQALALDPDDPDTLHMASLQMFATGRVKQALRARLTLRTREPFVPIFNIYTALALQLNGRTGEAIPILEAAPSEGGIGVQRNNFLALAYATAGRYALAADTILAIRTDQVLDMKAEVQEAEQLMRNAPAKIDAPEPTAASQSTGLNFVFAFTGAPTRVLDSMEYAIAINWANNGGVWLVWHPAFVAARKTERFKALMRNAGLVDYWRARGWPDLCHPVGTDDFVCD